MYVHYNTFLWCIVCNNCISGDYAEGVWAVWAQLGTISADLQAMRRKSKCGVVKGPRVGENEIIFFFGSPSFLLPFSRCMFKCEEMSYLGPHYGLSCKVKIIGGKKGCGGIDSNENLFLPSMIHKCQESMSSNYIGSVKQRWELSYTVYGNVLYISDTILG